MLKTLFQIGKQGIQTEPTPDLGSGFLLPAHRLRNEILEVLGRSLTIREVDAGSCNACELEIHATNNLYYNLEGIGIKFVASPRHADMLLVTGPVSRNMAMALKRTYDAMPAPKIVVAVGDCTINGGIFGENYACCGGVGKILPVDHFIRGCPPPPIELLKGILTAVRLRYGHPVVQDK
jgi:Ni,Fe-hydrogenase III small subunit